MERREWLEGAALLWGSSWITRHDFPELATSIARDKVDLGRLKLCADFVNAAWDKEPREVWLINKHYYRHSPEPPWSTGVILKNLKDPVL